MSPEHTEKLMEAVTVFSDRIHEVFGDGQVGQGLLGIAVEHMLSEKLPLSEVLRLAELSYRQSAALYQRLAPELGPEREPEVRVTEGYAFGRRVTGVGDDRSVGVTYCVACKLVNSHDDLGVCKRCVGPLEALRVPIGDVALVLGQQGGMSIVGPANDLSSVELAGGMLSLAQACWAVSPETYLLGVALGRMVRLGYDRDGIEEIVTTTVSQAEEEMAEEEERSKKASLPS